MSCKFASIRKNLEDPCPFGLPIPFGCKCAGKNIEQMATLNVMGDKSSDDEKEMISSANTKLLAWSLLKQPEGPMPCEYAGHILENKEAVECNYDDSAPGVGPAKALSPAPFYSKIFNEQVTGLFTCPTGYYGDYNVSRNGYYGILSQQGSDRADLIKKMAEDIIEKAKYSNNVE